MLTRLLPLALAAGLLTATAMAQTAPPTRIRGTIVALSGPNLTVQTREGSNVDVTLNDPLTVRTVTRVPLDGIKQGTYVGIASRTGADGQAQAIEVLVFPEAMRGAGEGHYAWDLEPGSMMTNANVSAVVQAKSGNTLTLTYKNGNTQIVVPPDAPIVEFAPAERADLKPGEKVMFGASKNAEGKLTASSVTVGTKGVAPPM